MTPMSGIKIKILGKPELHLLYQWKNYQTDSVHNQSDS